MINHFKILNKNSSLFHQQTDKYVRMIYKFDGTVTNFISALANTDVKANLISSRQLNIEAAKSIQSLYDLELRSVNIEERIVQLYSQVNNEKIIWHYGRSFWDKNQYNDILKGSQKQPIGLTIIRKKIPIFKKFQWYGKCSLNINNRQINNLVSRSYLVEKKYSTAQIQDVIPLYQLQEYFTPNFFSLFKN